MLSVLHTNVGVVTYIGPQLFSSMPFPVHSALMCEAVTLSLQNYRYKIQNIFLSTSFKRLKEAMKLGRGKASLRLGETLNFDRFETPVIKKLQEEGLINIRHFC